MPHLDQQHVGRASNCLLPMQISARDLERFGARHGIHYCFGDEAFADETSVKGIRTGKKPSHPILSGRVLEEMPRSDWLMTFSDVDVLASYGSCSRLAAPLFICIVLEGSIDVCINSRQHRLSAGSAMSVSLAEQFPLRVHQAAGQRLKTLNLSLGDSAISVLNQQAAFGSLLDAGRPQLHLWSLPGYVTPMLEQIATPQSFDGQRCLLLEAICLQLLSHGLPCEARAQRFGVTPGERERLERVRCQLHRAPAEPHSLAGLARQASMSPSSLRTKFQRYYGLSLFDYLRERRLQLAYQLLEQGHSVQQAAYLSGYNHATNFSTAFRRRFGISPSAVG
ncbi:helix-turn-helix transcriptional regulator [Halomonas halocynthiae]|uniref:helix-turn-helix transcriptional regulator n=1 Tax=Halomonas halocynthiae TaxID=176290 RepID=UPI00040E0292|nr:helix-turn-helix transcriptional regulator [Halomonas halocynthiae]